MEIEEGGLEEYVMGGACQRGNVEIKAKNEPLLYFLQHRPSRMVNSKLYSRIARYNLLLSSYIKIWRLKLNYITKFICVFMGLLKLI